MRPIVLFLHSFSSVQMSDTMSDDLNRSPHKMFPSMLVKWGTFTAFYFDVFPRNIDFHKLQLTSILLKY